MELQLQRPSQIAAMREGDMLKQSVISTFLSCLNSFRWLRKPTTFLSTPSAGDQRKQVVLEGDTADLIAQHRKSSFMSCKTGRVPGDPNLQLFHSMCPVPQQWLHNKLYNSH